MDHMGSILLLETLQDELKIFNKTGKKRWKKEGRRVQILEQKTHVISQIHDFTTALEAMEQLFDIQ